MPLAPTAIVTRRLHNQRLVKTTIHDPAEIVAWLGAVQAQDYPGAKWGLGLRTSRVTDAIVEQAFTEGRILRTHILRPTWHFVPPADIRWMLSISAPRVHAASGSVYRQCELDARTFSRSHAVIERRLRGGNYSTRAELQTALERAGIRAHGIRLACLMMCAELDAVICSGPRRGNQFTYALLEERVPRAPTLRRDEALAALARRYFTSRCPSNVGDYVWLSGLTVRDARNGIEMAGSALVSDVVDGQTYWFSSARQDVRSSALMTFLLSNYDEFAIAYRDREIVPSIPRPRSIAAPDIFAHLLFVGGQLVGRWKRRVLSDRVVIDAQPFRRLTKPEMSALETSAERYAKFLGVATTLRVARP
jgi:hypothetical protein